MWMLRSGHSIWKRKRRTATNSAVWPSGITTERRRSTMRGRGRVWRPLNGSGKPSNVWMLDYTVDGDRYRESSGLEVKKASKQDAVAELERRIKAAQEGRVLEPPKPKTLRAYVDAHLAAKPNEVDPRTGLSITPVWLKNVKRHLDRAVAFFGAER